MTQLLLRSRLAIALVRGFAHPAAGLALSTLTVFALALTSSWSWADSIGDVCLDTASSLCVHQGPVPCSAIACTATGSGYKCDIGAGVMVTEVKYKVTVPGNLTVWPTCQTGKAAQSCGGTWQACGTTLHYPTPATSCGLTCTGTWSWANCQASGDACAGG